jgi:hypothetical protein
MRIVACRRVRKLGWACRVSAPGGIYDLISHRRVRSVVACQDGIEKARAQVRVSRLP